LACRSAAFVAGSTSLVSVTFAFARTAMYASVSLDEGQFVGRQFVLVVAAAQERALGARAFITA